MELTSEIKTYEDFEAFNKCTVYAVKFSENITGGVLPFVDNISANEGFNVEDIFAGNPIPSEVILHSKTTEYNELDTRVDVYDILPVSGSWNDVENNLRPQLIGTAYTPQNVFSVSKRISTRNIINFYNFYIEKDIHLFPTKEDCEFYISECSKQMLKNICKCCKIKAEQYARTAKKLFEFYCQKYEEK